MRSRWNLMFPTMLTAMLLGGCGACDAFEAVDGPAPNLELTTLAGAPFSLESLQGKPVVVHFWLPWCHTCATEVPELMAAKEAAGPGVQFVAVSIDPDVESVRTRAALFGLDMTLLLAKGEVLGPMHVGAAPSTVYLDSHGVIRAAVSGPRDRAFHGRRIRALLE